MQEELTPQIGDYAVVPIQGIVGKLIRFGQWLNGSGFKNYEHAFIYVDYGCIVEAEPGGAKVSDLSEYSGRDMLWSSMDLTADQRLAIVAAAKKFTGVPYSFLDYLLIALKRFHITIPLLNRRVIGSKHMICSQLVAECYKAAGITLTDKSTYLVTPGDLANLLEK